MVMASAMGHTLEHGEPRGLDVNPTLKIRPFVGSAPVVGAWGKSCRRLLRGLQPG